MMISLHFNIEGISGPGGYVADSLGEILPLAASLSETALDQMDDLVNVLEWFDLSGAEANPRQLLHSEDQGQVEDVISQISDTMKSHGFGWIDLQSHSDFFSLIAYHNALDWVTDDFKERYLTLQSEYLALVKDFSDQWSAV